MDHSIVCSLVSTILFVLLHLLEMWAIPAHAMSHVAIILTVLVAVLLGCYISTKYL